jgi:hypothetical protein
MLRLAEDNLARIRSMLHLSDTARAKAYDELFGIGIPNG